MDESSRALRTDVYELTQALTSVAKQLDIGMDANLLSLYGYDTSIRTKFTLNQYTDKSSLVTALQTLPLFNRFHTGRTDTAEAISFLVDQAMAPQQGDRPNYPDAVIIVGDHATTSTTKIAITDRLALSAKSQDVIVVSIGSLGAETEQLATDNKHLIHVLSDGAFATQLAPALVQLLEQC